jgi:hypothetical protein
MFKYFYRTHIKNHFINQLFVSYSIILIATLIVILVIASINVSHIISNQSIDYNRQLLVTIRKNWHF